MGPCAGAAEGLATGQAQHLGGAETEVVLRRTVDADDAPLSVDLDDRVRRPLHDRGQLLALALEGPRRPALRKAMASS